MTLCRWHEIEIQGRRTNLIAVCCWLLDSYDSFSLCFNFIKINLRSLSSRRSSKKSVYALSCLSEVWLFLALKQFQCSSDWRWPSLVLSEKIAPATPYHASLHRVIDGVMSLASSPPPSPPPPPRRPTSLSTGSFPVTTVCLAQYIHRSFRRRMSNIPLFTFL